MATAAIIPSHLLESRMFSQVLNLYVANSVAHFLSATLALLCSDRLCDFCSAVQRRAMTGGFFGQNSNGEVWPSSLIDRQAALAASIRSHRSSGKNIVPIIDSLESDALPAMEDYRRDVMQVLKTRHAVLLFIGDANSPAQLQFSLHRFADATPFEVSDLQRLEVLQRYIFNAWSLLSERLASQAMLDGISIALRNYHRGTLMLDSRLRIVWHNRAARECLQSWRELGRSSMKVTRALGPLPSEILMICQELRQHCSDVCPVRDPRKVHLIRHAADPRLRATVKLFGGKLADLASPNFIVQFDQAASGQKNRKDLFADSLTNGEREVAGLVRTGMSNQEIADRLGKTVVAIKFHLHRMFKKADVTTRSRLMLRLTER